MKIGTFFSIGGDTKILFKLIGKTKTHWIAKDKTGYTMEIHKTQPCVPVSETKF